MANIESGFVGAGRTHVKGLRKLFADVYEDEEFYGVSVAEVNNRLREELMADIMAGDDGVTRTFTSGATRDTIAGKFEYGGFLSPAVLRRFAAYMHEHRKQSDGSLRASDNWQKGIPIDAYMESLLRHVMDVWMHWRGEGGSARENYQNALCALLFNVQGLLFEDLHPNNYSDVVFPPLSSDATVWTFDAACGCSQCQD